MATTERQRHDAGVQGRDPGHGHERLLLPAEAAELLRVSLPQLYHLTSERRIAFLKVGGQLRFERAALLESVAQAAMEREPRRGSRNGGQRVARTPAASRSARTRRFRFATPPRRK